MSKNKPLVSMCLTVVLAVAMVVPVFADVHVESVDITDNGGEPTWTTNPEGGSSVVWVDKSGSDEYVINGLAVPSDDTENENYVVDSSTDVTVNGGRASYEGSSVNSGVEYHTFKAGGAAAEEEEESHEHHSSSNESSDEPLVDPITMAINSSFLMETAAGTNSFGTDASLVAEECGPAAQAAFVAAMPGGFTKGFSFSIVNGQQASYSLKSGKFSFRIPAQYIKAGRKFKLLGIDKNGKVKEFENVSTEDGLFAANVDIEGYAFELVYAD